MKPQAEIRSGLAYFFPRAPPVPALRSPSLMNATDPSPVQPPSNKDLADLIAQVGLGDRAAFARYYERTSGHVLGLIVRMHPQRDQADAVLQEIYITVWRSAGSYDSHRAQPMTWLMSIARHRAIDALRRRDGAATAALLSEHAAPPPRNASYEIGADTSPPPELLGAAMLARAVRGCLYSISTEQQQSLALAYYHGLSHAEVAEQLHQSPATVKGWLRSCLLALRACLERRADAG
jgi:RNA polymerase sigma-70 factor (ECF subfamily)